MSAPTPTTASRLSPTAEVFTPRLQTGFDIPDELAKIIGQAELRELVLTDEDVVDSETASDDETAPDIPVRCPPA